MSALAITDHGNMFGAIEFYELCKDAGIKPIIGCEAYIAPGSRFEKSSHGIQDSSYHLVLLAKDIEGYKNLMKLVSLGYLEGFYYKPRIDKELLAENSKGLICLSACLKSEVSHLILSNQVEQAYKAADEFNNIFGKDNFYLEIMDHNLKEQKIVNKHLLKMAKDLSIGLVATNDFHYLQKTHAFAHEVLMGIGTQKTISDPERMRFGTEEFYFKNSDEMIKLFKDIPEAIANTLKIADMCNMELDLSKYHLPHFNVPNGKTHERYLKELVEDGLKKRYHEITEEIRERVSHELKIIQDSGFISYFLITWDFIRYAKENNIAVGPGRGSAAGSVVSYALGITDIDPLPYGLLFERFLNPERVTMPDIDIDFCYERRDEVIQYVRQKYGEDNVAQIITFGKMQAKAVIRDVARVMDFTYADADHIAKLIPNELNIKLADAIEQEPELMTMYKSDEKITQLIDTALILEGVTRHASTHAAGVVISEDGLFNYVPLFKQGDGQVITAYAMTSLEKIGLLKMDFLGLRTLTVIQETVKIVKRTQGIDIDMNNIPLDDKKPYDMLSEGDSIGVFQVESRGMRDILRKLKPSVFEDIIALLALYRPGPIGSGMVDDFIDRRHGRLKVKYDHQLLEDILKSTYGIILYQEQVMQIVSRLAGFSLSHADLLRRAIGKKKAGILQQQREAFVSGCLNNNIEQKIADKIFNLIEYFSNYGFNKSHSTAYALISYRTAYLKARYPVEFMAALLTSERENTDKVALYIDESAHMGINILPPDINESFAHFTVIKGAIRFGLAAVKNVGSGAIESIVEARKKRGLFKDIYDFCEHVDLRLVNRKVIESLIKCGAMDCFNLRRSQLTAMLDHALDVAGVLQRDRLSGQYSLFDNFEADDQFKNHFQQIPDVDEWPQPQLLAFEKALLGFYISSHPLAQYENTLKLYVSADTEKLGSLKDGDMVTIGGIISKIRFTFTKKTSEKMAILRLEDLKGNTEVIVFPRSFKNSEAHIHEDEIVLIKGRVNLREEVPKIFAEEILSIDEAMVKYAQAFILVLNREDINTETLNKIVAVLFKYRGEVRVQLLFKMSGGKVVQMEAGRDMCVTPSDELVKELKGLIGTGSVKIKV